MFGCTLAAIQRSYVSYVKPATWEKHSCEQKQGEWVRQGTRFRCNAGVEDKEGGASGYAMSCTIPSISLVSASLRVTKGTLVSA